MGQPEGEEERLGDAPPGPLPEGGEVVGQASAGDAPHSPQRAGVRFVRGEPVPARAMIALDLLLEMNEPVLLMRELQTAASVKQSRSPHLILGAEWGIVFKYANACLAELEANQEPKVG